MSPMESPPPVDEQKAKKPYVAPKLVRLGSVRDLTFGTSQGTKPDGGFSRISDK